MTVLKVSDAELRAEGMAVDDDRQALVDVLRHLQERGAANVVVSRGAEPTLARCGDTVYEMITPELEASDPSGGGDSLTAGMAAGLARGNDITDALRLGGAAGALNVTRRGLASGSRDQIERFAERVELRKVKAGRAPRR